MHWLRLVAAIIQAALLFGCADSPRFPVSRSLRTRAVHSYAEWRARLQMLQAMRFVAQEVSRRASAIARLSRGRLVIDLWSQRPCRSGERLGHFVVKAA